jgi:glycyl-tRNA synthetase beta chain
MPADLLFELGCEEIPAKMLTRALAELPAQVEAKLAAARLEHKGVRAIGTPRRIAIIVKGLAERQPDLREEVVGPPVGAAFAPDGTLTKAGQGFATKNGVDASAIQKKEVAGKKGQYAVALREVAGQDARALLPALLVELVTGITWPKQMRWGWSETTFVRPVQWLVAIFGGEVVPMQWAGQTAGRHSRGHRFLANGPVEIASADAYEGALRAAHVIVDPEKRTQMVKVELDRLARETGLRVRPDDALVAEVIHLGEYPVGCTGTFDESFLEVPEEMIVTAMRNHQRYFALETADGKLAPRFATVMATIVKDAAVVSRGNETVLRSRLSDAKFFFGEDRKKTFADWNKKLDAVVFQAKLGDKAKTIGDKVRRLESLVGEMAQLTDCDAAIAVRAAAICKADLASGAVGEFPELQGTMGRHYARIAGEVDGVARAIEQSWWPKGQGAALPATPEAALVALADRLDTLVGCFATGLVPSGNADPLGLRRAAIGVLAILLDRGDGGAHYRGRWPHELDRLVQLAAAAYGETLVVPDAALAQLHEFFKGRLRGYLIDEEGLDAGAVDVALGAGSSDPSDVRVRAKALAIVPTELRALFKRIGNILDDAAAKGFGTAQELPDSKRFASPDGVEQKLLSEYGGRSEMLRESLYSKQYRDAFILLAELTPFVAALFDKDGGVMVMDPDPAIRENRLALLRMIYTPLAIVGDFRSLPTPAAKAAGGGASS